MKTASAIDHMRLGLHRDLLKTRQDFRLATPRSTGARAAESARLTVRRVCCDCPGGLGRGLLGLDPVEEPAALVLGLLPFGFHRLGRLDPAGDADGHLPIVAMTAVMTAAAAMVSMTLLTVVLSARR